MVDKIVKINIEDWLTRLDELLRKEKISFDSYDEIVEFFVNEGIETSSEIGEIMIAAKQAGLVSDELWPEHKVNLSRGGAYSTRLLYKSRSRVHQLENGKKVKIRDYIGKVSSQEFDVTQKNNAQAYISIQSDYGIMRSKDYLFTRVIGHIRERFKELALSGEDLKVIADELKSKIDEIVEEYS